MPQLMPFFWVNSVLVIFLILFTFIIFYYLKSMENMDEMYNDSDFLKKFSFKW